MSDGLPVYVVGGYVASINDDDLHYVSAPELLRLYGLDRDAVTWIGEDASFQQVLWLPERAVILGPRFEGDYRQHLEDVGLA